MRVNCSMFDHYPETRKYFKGHENKVGADVLKSDFFVKQGAKIYMLFMFLVPYRVDFR